MVDCSHDAMQKKVSENTHILYLSFSSVRYPVMVGLLLSQSNIDARISNDQVLGDWCTKQSGKYTKKQVSEPL